MKVYVVIVFDLLDRDRSTGDLSDKNPRVAGVFSDLSRANCHLDGHVNSDGVVEEHELDEIVVAPKRGLM